MKSLPMSVIVASLIVCGSEGWAQSKTSPAATHEHMSEKSSLIVTPDYIFGPEDVLEITVRMMSFLFPSRPLNAGYSERSL